MCRVSIIIPYYNSEKTIIRALESVTNQTYKDFEIILVDDGSTDNSHKLVDEFMVINPKYKIKNLHQENSGPSKARNNGMRNCNGKYIAFLDADDSWVDSKLEKQVYLLEKENAHLIGCNYNIIINAEINPKNITKKKIKEVSFKECLFKHFFIPSTSMVSRKAIFEIGLFPEDQKYMEDAYVFKLINRKYKSILLGEHLTNFYKYLYGDSGLSLKLRYMEKYELLNFKYLRNENNKYDKKINLFLYTIIVSFSYFKYLRRVIISRLRK